MNLVGIDIGTQGVKAALYSAEGECRAEAFEPSRPLRPAPGIVEEDPEFQLASACRVMQECARKSGASDVAAIGIAGQMAGVIGLGADGRAVTPYDSWLDTRCAAQITRMRTEAGDAVLRATGNAPSATVTETTDTSAPSCVSDRPQSAFMWGNSETITWRST